MAQNTDAVTNTGPGSEKIRAEIERTRATMDDTFDALEAKLTPGQLLGEVWSLTKGGSTAGASKLWRVAREYPMPSAVIGLGLGWLLVESSRGEDSGSRRSSRYYDRDFDDRSGERSGSAGSSRRFAGSDGSGAYDDDFTGYDRGFDSDAGSSGRLSRAKDAVSGAAHSAKETVSDAAHSARETVSDAAHSAKDAVAGVASNVREKAGDVADRARDRASELGGQARWKVRQARTGFWQMMESNPLAMGAATLALGVLAGLAIPSTRKEDELLGETRDHLVEDLKERSQEVLEKGRQVAESTMETVKQVAQDEGLTVEGVAEKVRHVGREAKNKVQEEVKNQDLLPGGAPGEKGEKGPQAGNTAPSAAAGAGTGNFGGALGGGASTPSPTVGGTPGERMGGAGGPAAGARVEENEPELLKR